MKEQEDTQAEKHLWEIDHPYYCNLGNYFTNGCGNRFKSWQEFLDVYEDADFDMNLIFRWDWREGVEHELPEFNGDVNYRNGELQIFWLKQRKGIYDFSTIEVCRADEEKIREFLQPRWEHLIELWEGVSK